MTGRRRLSEEERRSQILRATIEVVARHGFDRASASLIAEHAGVSKGLIWRYFTDKTELMKQAVTMTMRAVGSEIDSALGTPDSAAEGIRAHLRGVVAVYAKHPDDFSALDQITRALRGPDGTYAFSLRDYEDIYRGQEEIFRRGQDNGLFREFDVRVMAVTYQGAIDMMLSYFASHPETDREAYADALAEVLSGLIAR